MIRYVLMEREKRTMPSRSPGEYQPRSYDEIQDEVAHALRWLMKRYGSKEAIEAAIEKDRQQKRSGDEKQQGRRRAASGS